MMHAEALVQLALNNMSCSQKDLAQRLGVSPAQISKWKKGEHMSSDMEQRIRELSQIGGKDPEFVLLSGSLENAVKWEKLIFFLAEWIQADAETGYNTIPLQEKDETLCMQTFHTLKGMGVDFPSSFPEELDFDYEQVMEDSDDADAKWDLLEKNPYSSLISDIFRSFNDVYGFYAAYVSELMNDDDLNLYDTDASDIEYCLMDLAASKVDVDIQLAPSFKHYKYKVTKDFTEWLNIIKEKAFRAGIPLRAELLSMVYGSSDELSHEAEAESLGFNASRIHPDIYMNELLCGMRVIHQVLPAIMKKLGIDQDFELNDSELRAR